MSNAKIIQSRAYDREDNPFYSGVIDVLKATSNALGLSTVMGIAAFAREAEVVVRPPELTVKSLEELIKRAKTEDMPSHERDLIARMAEIVAKVKATGKLYILRYFVVQEEAYQLELWA